MRVLAGEKAEYTVHFAAPDYRKAKVRASIPLSQNLLLMEQGAAKAFQDGWSTFVGHLQANSPSGERIKLNRTGKDRWEVLGQIPQRVELGYTVVLGHDKFPDKWMFGYQQAAYGRDDYAFYTGKSLFIASPGLDECRISFVLPSDWKVLAGWREFDGSPNTFVASGESELWHTALVVGNQRAKTVQLDGVSSTVASRKTMKKSVDLLAGTIGKLLPEASQIFGATPQEKVLIVTDYDPEYPHEGGEAFNRSMLLIFQKPASEDNKSQWVHTLTHELIHLWMGYAIQFGAEHREEWFLEGATDYLANLLQARIGIINLDQLVARMNANYTEYTKRAGKVSLGDAGANKASNYNMIYSGGMMVALALDSEIRSRTGNRHGIEKLLQQMYVHAKGTGSRVSNQWMCDAVKSIVERNMQLFFDDYVNGLATVSPEDYCEPLGLVVKNGIISPASGDDGAELRRDWIGRPVGRREGCITVEP